MEFDVLIPTCNRQLLLPVSVPLILSQERLPRRLIVVDSSDDHLEVRRVLERIVSDAGANISLQVLRSEPGISRQRNVGLRHVRSPVVLSPEDDALWFPGVAASTMRIYERDHEGRIGAVCPVQSMVPPPGVLGPERRAYLKSLAYWLAASVDPLRLVDRKLFPDPLLVVGRSTWAKREPPNWLHEENAHLCGPMTGFRMSFRTDLIRSLGFDEALGTYSLFQERDVSLGILKHHLIVCVRTAKVFHCPTLQRRVDGRVFGMLHVLNRTYVVCKHTQPGSPERRMLKRYLYYKMARYLLQSCTRYGRQRFAGACQVLSRVPQLLDTPTVELPQRYASLRSECFARWGQNDPA